MLEKRPEDNDNDDNDAVDIEHRNRRSTRRTRSLSRAKSPRGRRLKDKESECGHDDAATESFGVISTSSSPTRGVARRLSIESTASAVTCSTEYGTSSTASRGRAKRSQSMGPSSRKRTVACDNEASTTATPEKRQLARSKSRCRQRFKASEDTQQRPSAKVASENSTMSSKKRHNEIPPSQSTSVSPRGRRNTPDLDSSFTSIGTELSEQPSVAGPRPRLKSKSHKAKETQHEGEVDAIVSRGRAKESSHKENIRSKSRGRKLEKGGSHKLRTRSRDARKHGEGGVVDIPRNHQAEKSRHKEAYEIRSPTKSPPNAEKHRQKETDPACTPEIPKHRNMKVRGTEDEKFPKLPEDDGNDRSCRTSPNLQASPERAHASTPPITPKLGASSSGDSAHVSPESTASKSRVGGIGSKISALKSAFRKAGNKNEEADGRSSRSVSRPSSNGVCSPVQESKVRRPSLDNGLAAPSLRHIEVPPSPFKGSNSLLGEEDPHSSPRRKNTSFSFWAQKAGQPSHEESSSPSPEPAPSGSPCSDLPQQGARVEWTEVDFTSLDGKKTASSVVRRRRSQLASPYATCSDGEDEKVAENVASPSRFEAEESPAELLQKLKRAGITSKQLNKLKQAGLKITED